MYTILVDKRERAILSVLGSENIIGAGFIKWRAEHLTVGDFLILCGEKAVLIIERKTWADLAASFRDGRKENINKLLQYREQTGAKIAYLIEGTAFPAKNTKFSRIPYKALRSHLDHLIVRDGIIELRAAGHIDTVHRIFEFVHNMSSIKGGDEPKAAAAESKSFEAAAVKSSEAAAVKSFEAAAESTTTDLGLAKLQHRLTDAQVKNKMWCCLHITNRIVGLFQKYKIADFLLSKISMESISNLSHQNGRKIGLAKSKKIYFTTKLDRQENKSRYIKLLASIPGISLDTARIILEAYPMRMILENWNDVRGDLENLSRGKRKVGKKIADNIKYFLLE